MEESITSPKRHLSERPANTIPTSPRREAFGGRTNAKTATLRHREVVLVKTMTEEEKQAAAKAEYEKLLTMRSGGTYIPPARLRALQSQITDKTSKEYQRMAWEALKKSINGLINKVNVSNIKHIVPELFSENLVRGRGLFCRSIMKAQAASLPFTPIYAAMAAIVNTKLPQVGELLLNRLIVQFRKAFKRNDKAVCLSSTTFIAHLCNQQVAHEVVAAQILLLLLHKPTDDSVEVAVGLTREVGQHLEEMSAPIALAVFDQFRGILHEADIDKRVQYMIEVLFQVRKDRYKDNPSIREELDLVEEEDQITHRTGLDDEIDVQDGLNVFKYDPEWEEHEEAYKRLKAEILGEGSDEDDYEEDDDDSDDSEDDAEKQEEKTLEIKDQSNTDLVNLRRTIYLTIMSSIDPEECCHKLMKVTLPPGQEPELPSMIIECCSQERTYSKFYGLIGERFAKINRLWTDLFEQSFAKYYDTIHRYETNRLRNIARFFGHLISSDAIGWHVLSVVHLNEEETTSSSRIFIKVLFQDLAEAMGMSKLQARLKDDILRPSFDGLFPRDNPRNTRFSINYFTSIGMGAVTEEMREFLQNMPKTALPAPPPPVVGESDSETGSSISSYSSYTGSSYSGSRSQSRGRDASRERSVSRTSPRRSRVAERSRGRSFTRSITHSVTRSLTPARRSVRRELPSITLRKMRRRGDSDSRSPPPRRTTHRNAYSPSPPTHRRGAYETSPSPVPVRRRRNTSSVSAAPRRRRRESVSRSPPPAMRRSERRNTSSISASPPRRRDRDASSPGRRHRDYRDENSPEPVPRRSARRDRGNDSVTPPPVKRRRDYSDSRSPPSKRGRR
jgi:pre-mRNA-splicing factor CWC22